jgi:hypothetical protein
MKVWHLVKLSEEFFHLVYRNENCVILIMMIFPDLVELIDSLVVKGSLFLHLDILIGLADDGYEELQEDQTHD